MMELTLMCKGTPEEIAAIIQFVQFKMTASTLSLKTAGQADSSQLLESISPDLMSKALTRLPLTPHTKKMLLTLCEVEKDGRFVRRSKLREALGFKPDEDAKLNGVLGRFGVRVRRTDGYDGSPYFEYKRVDGEWRYRIPDRLREVVRQVLDNGDHTAGEIREAESDNDSGD